MYLLRNELKLQLKSKTTLLVMLVAWLVMGIGINSLNFSNDFSLYYINKSSSTIAFASAKFAASICALLFGLYTALALDKDKRSRSKAIIASNQSYYHLFILRMGAIIIIELMVTLGGMVLVMGMQQLIYGIPIQVPHYLFNYFVVFFPTLLFSTLIIGGLYLLTDSLDISLITLGVISVQSLLSSNYLLTWVQTNLEILSDFAGIQPVGKTILYNRLLWCLISIAIFCLGSLFKRAYGFNWWHSLLINTRSKGLVLILLLALLGSGFTYLREPYTMELARDLGPIEERVALIGLRPQVIFNSEKGTMWAEVAYEFENRGADRIKFSTNGGLNIDGIKVNGQGVPYQRDWEKNLVEVPIPNGKEIEVVITYGGTIKTHKNGVGRGMPGYISKDSIYLLENVNWILRPWVKKGDSIGITGSYTAPQELTMVVPGVLLNTTTKEGMKTWEFTYESHTADLGAFGGKYQKSEIAFENMKVEFYYAPHHKDYIQRMEMEAHIQEIMKYYTEQIGPYYSEIYPLKIAEVALYKRGGHSSENVITISENMLNRDGQMAEMMDPGSVDFSPMRMDVFMNDISTIAHEMAHQWWGTGVNVVEESPWSSEGLAQYCAYKYIQSSFGEMESSLFLSRWHSRVSELRNYYYLNHSEMLDKVKESYGAALAAEKLQAELYYLMPMKLIQGEATMGESEFLERLRDVYQNHLLKDLTYEAFLNEMKLSEEDMEIE